MHSVLEAAESLGDHAVLHSNTQTRTKCKRPIKYHTIRPEIFIANISSIPVPSLDDNIERVADECANILYKCSTESEQRRSMTCNAKKNQWYRITEEKDSALLWRRIGWNGKFDASPSSGVPSDDEFRVHFEELLNPDDTAALVQEDIISDTYIPILDDPIQPEEVKYVIDKQLKSAKSAGPDGIAPGIFKLLPQVWIVFLCQLFNMVFYGSYPSCWSYSRLVTIFRKGPRSL